MSTSLRPHFSLAGLAHGARIVLPAFPGMIMFAVAFGTSASQKGLTLAQALGMSAFVYAGAAQMVALQIWQDVWSPATLLTVIAVTGVVNARMILLGATLHPWLRNEPIARTALNLFVIGEANWLVATRYYNEGGRDTGVLLGAGLTLWVVWNLSTLTGFSLGALVPEPKRFGLDFVMPIFFGLMLVPLWKGAKPALPWLVAGIVSLIAHALVPGYFFIVAGAVSGVIAGMLIE